MRFLNSSSFRSMPRSTFRVLLAVAALAAGTVAASAQSTDDARRPDLLLDAQVRSGVLTIDGMVGKVRLNYDIQNAEYLYLYIPGRGTAVVSPDPMPNSQPVAMLKEGTLDIPVDGHRLQLTGIEHAQTVNENGKSVDKHPQRMWVSIDRSQSAETLGRTPMLGFGSSLAAPYAWPGAMPQQPDNKSAGAPPLPRNVLPSQVETSSVTPQ